MRTAPIMHQFLAHRFKGIVAGGASLAFFSKLLSALNLFLALGCPLVSVHRAPLGVA